MTRSGEIWRSTRAALALLLLLPFFAVQLFAPDTMPGLGPHGLRVELCGDSGLRSVIIDADGTPHPADQPTDSHPACAWATAAIHAFVAPAAPAAVAPATLLAGEGPVLRATRAVASGAAPGPQARAPPARV